VLLDPPFLREPTRHLFFTGKGGVGKTSVACATAVHLADAGRKVLLVSTDPASNLDEVLGVRLGMAPTSVPDVAGLEALNLDPEAAAREYREKLVGPYRGLLPEAAIRSMEEQLSGSCTVEIAAFDAFSRLLGDPAATARFDHVIFDTAPTGHTLRLLSLPGAWQGFIAENRTGTSCLGPLAGLAAQKAIYDASVAALADAARTTLVLVTRPDRAAIREAARSSDELAKLGVANQHLVVNGVLETDGADPVAAAFAARGAGALADLPEALAGLPTSSFPLRPDALLGAAALRRFLSGGSAATTMSGPDDSGPLPPSLGSLLDDLAAPGHGAVLVMGKGGVGKTTVAAAVAVGLARRGLPVTLTTTDPAAHVGWVLARPLPNLRVTRIDPAAETAAYRDEVLATAGAGLDPAGRALLEEDLRSPCTEEVAVFRAFARTVEDAAGGFVVLDTAPTGHTLLLLDATLAYHREVLRQASGMPAYVQRLLPRLRDPSFTRVLLVTLAEATPVHEAERLQADLARAGIAPFAWVVNASLAATGTEDPVLGARGRGERRWIAEVRERLAVRAILVPWSIATPDGVDRLTQLLALEAGDRTCPTTGGSQP
jgi:arsenite-transporting ATPase